MKNLRVPLNMVLVGTATTNQLRLQHQIQPICYSRLLHIGRWLCHFLKNGFSTILSQTGCQWPLFSFIHSFTIQIFIEQLMTQMEEKEAGIFFKEFL